MHNEIEVRVPDPVLHIGLHGTEQPHSTNRHVTRSAWGGGRVHPGSCEEVVQDRDFMALLHQPVNQVAPAYPGPQTFTHHANLHRALLRVFTSMRSIDLPTVGGHPTKPAPPVTKIRLRCPRGRSRTPTCPTPADKRASDSFWSRATLSSLVTTRIRRSTCTKPAM